MGTLIWTDNFDSYTAGSPVPSPWTQVSNSPVSTAQFHSSPNSLPAGTGGNGSAATRPFGSNLSIFYADFWMWVNSTGASTNQFVSFSDSGTVSSPKPSVNVASTGTLHCGLSNSTVWFSSSVTLNAWHHYLLELNIANAGTAKLTVDGVVAGTFSGDTRPPTLSTFASNVWLAGAGIGPSPPAEFYVDDLSISSGVVASGAKPFFRGPFGMSTPSLLVGAAAMRVYRGLERNPTLTRRGIARRALGAVT